MTNYISIINHHSRLFILTTGLIYMASCTVTNNLYVANPNPMGKGNSQTYLGLGTGLKAKIDSVNNSSGEIYFSNKISTAPILSVGGQWGVSNKTDFRFALHVPFVIGGIGSRIGIQHSFLNLSSKMNFAIGFDLGGVYAKDSIKIFGSKRSPVDRETNGGLNADIFFPFCHKFNNDISITITPRYSFNIIYIRKYLSDNKTNKFNLEYPTLSLGVTIRKYYFEMTTIYYGKKIYPHFGFAKLLKSNE